MFLSFEGMSRLVLLNGCDELKPLIFSILRDWDIREEKANDAYDPIIKIEKMPHGYVRTSPWLDEPVVFQDKVNATCDFLVDLIKFYITDGRPQLCLHCAAVSFDDGLMIFPSSYEAGKSIMSVQLASLGAVVFADDVLPIAENGDSGMAPGILPRLRLPFPEDSHAAFIDFVANRNGIQNKRFQYVDLKKDELATFKTESRITRIITLNRDPKGKTELLPVKTSDMLRDSIMRNFSSEIPAIEILDRLHRIVESADCFSLRYVNADDGARLLRDTFKQEKTV